MFRSGFLFVKRERNRAPARDLRSQSRRGQSIIEYVLLTAFLSTAAAGFMTFYGKTMFGQGLGVNGLPLKVSACISHQAGLAGNCQ